MEISSDKPARFTIHIRIPTWAGSKTSVRVNGERVTRELIPGTFAALDRTWKDGDRIELEFEARTTLEAVDPQHPSVVAAVNGPLTLFAVGKFPKGIQRRALESMEKISIGSDTWQAKTETGVLTLKPFASIQDEIYRLYQQVES